MDPVGVGASKFRKDFINELLETYKISSIRGNISEIKSILNLSSNTKGADVSKEDLESIDNTLNIAKELANKLSLVVAITGETDVISDGKRVVTIKMVTIFCHILQEQVVCVALWLLLLWSFK